MFKLPKSSMYNGSPLGNLLSHPVVFGSALLLGVVQTAHYLQRPVVDIPEPLGCLYLLNWILLLMYSVGYLFYLAAKTSAWVTGAARKDAEPHYTARFGWRFFLCSFEAAAVVLFASTLWAALDASRSAPATDSLFKACVRGMHEPGLRYLAKNLPDGASADEMRMVCLSAFLEDRKPTVKAPESVEELRSRYGSP